MLSIGLTNMTEGMTKNDAIIESLKINFVPIFLTSFTTAAVSQVLTLGIFLLIAKWLILL